MRKFNKIILSTIPQIIFCGSLCLATELPHYDIEFPQEFGEEFDFLHSGSQENLALFPNSAPPDESSYMFGACESDYDSLALSEILFTSNLAEYIEPQPEPPTVDVAPTVTAKIITPKSPAPVTSEPSKKKARKSEKSANRVGKTSKTMIIIPSTFLCPLHMPFSPLDSDISLYFKDKVLIIINRHGDRIPTYPIFNNPYEALEWINKHYKTHTTLINIYKCCNRYLRTAAGFRWQAIPKSEITYISHTL